jgi:quinol-cytochrome oxidoreductase complex cytochrome b subunit
MELQSHSETRVASREDKQVPFFPNVLLAEASLAVAVIGLLIILVALFPLKLADKYDPLNPPTILEPEWYFMGVYQFLKTQNVQPIHGILMIMGVGAFLLLVPFLDRSSERRPLRRPIFTSIGVIMIVEFLSLTVYGYMSPGQTGSFSNPQFVEAIALATSLAFCLVFIVLAGSKRTARGMRP